MIRVFKSRRLPFKLILSIYRDFWYKERGRYPKRYKALLDAKNTGNKSLILRLQQKMDK